MATPEQTQTQVCYRHPGRETGVRCSNCERPICTDCMVYAAVGIKCPECAGRATGARGAARRVQRSAGEGTGGLVTRVLIGLNVAVYVLQVAQSPEGLRGPSGEVFEKGALWGPAVADGEWWRMLTSAFLHANPIHLLLNMLMLWWFGQALEAFLGRGRFLGLYLVSALAGSSGALLLTPDARTVGASGAVFGILGAGLVLERRNIPVFGGAALAVVLLNLLFTFAGPVSVSIGGHVGGFVGGVLAVLALAGFGPGHPAYRRIDLLTIASLAGVAVLSIAVAYLRVRGYA
ncbi:MAG TPA: rhomboid family intramembrane serine protease [Gaiellaceae bacterium]|nr:rhomboid family intramembrane serine protease [Gaiellaceae bacterium]